MFPISGDFLWLWKRAKESENNLLNNSRNSDEGSTLDFCGVSICACDPSTSAQGYRAAKSKRTAKSCVCVCKDVTDWLHKSERRNLWPQPDTLKPNHSHKSKSIPFCLSNGSLTFLSHATPYVSSDAYCRIIHVVSVWLPQRAKKKESLALSDRFYCGNERRSLSFFFFFLVHLPLLRCCLTQQTKLCKETKKVWLQMHLVEKSKMRSEMFSSLDVISIL